MNKTVKIAATVRCVVTVGCLIAWNVFVISTTAVLSSNEDLFGAKNLTIELDVLYVLTAFLCLSVLAC